MMDWRGSMVTCISISETKTQKQDVPKDLKVHLSLRHAVFHLK